jgi:hypothetical protein
MAIVGGLIRHHKYSPQSRKSPITIRQTMAGHCF